MTSNSNLPKKRGRPVGSKNKRYKRPAKKVAAKDNLFKQFDPAATLEKIRAIDAMVADQQAKILNLEHQAIGYKAVISYLEYQLGTMK